MKVELILVCVFFSFFFLLHTPLVSRVFQLVHITLSLHLRTISPLPRHTLPLDKCHYPTFAAFSPPRALLKKKLKSRVRHSSSSRATSSPAHSSLGLPLSRAHISDLAGQHRRMAVPPGLCYPRRIFPDSTLTASPSLTYTQSYYSQGLDRYCVFWTSK